MIGQDALRIIDRLLAQHQYEPLKDIQVAILLQVWEGSSYPLIARELGYAEEYVKQVASQFWKLLSEILGARVTKKNIRSMLMLHRAALTQTDWGEAIDVSHFYGRQKNLQALQDWILDDYCRVVGIFGWGGIGKTALSVKLTQQIESQFECVVWRSLRQAPTPEDLLQEILSILMGSEIQKQLIAIGTNAAIALLMQQLQQKRCLLVFDNIESILQPGHKNGCYLDGYAAYGQIFERISDENHQSCMVITGREKPNGLTLREGPALPVRFMQLSRLPFTDAQHILINKGITATISDQHNLIDYVNGNPLALNILATTIKNLFHGNIQAFFAQGTTVFGTLWYLLDQQFERLTALQQQIMYWLAINQEGITIMRLQAELVPSITPLSLLEALETLRDRSLIESTDRGLTQQPVILKYVTEKFIQQIVDEIITGEINIFKNNALIDTKAEDYLHDAQTQFILQPLVDRLLTHFDTRARLENHLCHILIFLRHQPRAVVGYAEYNLHTLFYHLNTDPQCCDFSHIDVS